MSAIKLKPSLSLTVLSIFLVSCTAGPDYHRPLVPAPLAFKEAKGKQVVGVSKVTASKEWKIGAPRDQIARGEWWKIFHDPTLNQLEDGLNKNNQTVASAYANFVQARALVDEARASYFPTLSSSVTLTRQKQGGGTTSFVSTSSTGTSTGTATTSGRTSGGGIVSTGTLLLNATWEPDLWGLVRRTVEASAANAQASAALFSNTQLSAQASLAQYYFELRGVDTDQKLLNDTVISYTKALKLTRNQYNAGIVSRSDVVQAQTQLDTARSAAINIGITRAQYEHAIAVLVGIPPANFSLAKQPLHATPPPIPVGVPSALLERRPDVAQAERLMAQANAQIGVAVAAFYPTFSLTGTASIAGRGLAHILALPDLGWAYGPQLTQLIYDGGLRNATIAAASSGYGAAVATYKQTVLTAFQDVEDNLAALRLLQEQSIVQNQAAANAVVALKLMINQYKAGTVAYTDVITAQTAAYTAQKNAADINYLRMTAAVGLIKALGGGWDAASLACMG